MTNNQSIRSVEERVLLVMHFTKAQMYKIKAGTIVKSKIISAAPILTKFSIIDRYNESVMYTL